MLRGRYSSFTHDNQRIGDTSPTRTPFPKLTHKLILKIIHRKPALLKRLIVLTLRQTRDGEKASIGQLNCIELY